MMKNISNEWNADQFIGKFCTLNNKTKIIKDIYCNGYNKGIIFLFNDDTQECIGFEWAIRYMQKMLNNDPSILDSKSYE
jgi:hypothetical protein